MHVVERTPSLDILLLADSHLGFDLPVRPRTERRRRGHDFLANYHRALEPARLGEVDVVVHAGDVSANRRRQRARDGGRLLRLSLRVTRCPHEVRGASRGDQLARRGDASSAAARPSLRRRRDRRTGRLRVHHRGRRHPASRHSVERTAFAEAGETKGFMLEAHRPIVSASNLRAIAPSTMNVEVVPVDRPSPTSRRAPVRASATPRPSGETQLSLL